MKIKPLESVEVLAKKDGKLLDPFVIDAVRPRIVKVGQKIRGNEAE